jgi:hypothetical protein
MLGVRNYGPNPPRTPRFGQAKTVLVGNRQSTLQAETILHLESNIADAAV